MGIGQRNKGTSRAGEVKIVHVQGANILFKLLLVLLIALMAYTAISWAVFSPNLTFDQRSIAAASGLILAAIMFGATITCICSRGRIRIR